MVSAWRRESSHCSQGRNWCLEPSPLSLHGTEVSVCEINTKTVTLRAVVKPQCIWGMAKENCLSPWWSSRNSARSVAGWLRRALSEATLRGRLKTEEGTVIVETNNHHSPFPPEEFQGCADALRGTVATGKLKPCPEGLAGDQTDRSLGQWELPQLKYRERKGMKTGL